MRWFRRLVVAALWGAAAALCVVQYRAAWTGGAPGYDVRPLYMAAKALRAGHSVYEVRMFVYPPTAAVMALPLTAAGPSAVIPAVLAAAAALLPALGALTVYAVVPPHPWRHLLAAALAVVVTSGGIAQGEVYMGNASLVIALGVVTIVWLAGRGRWWWACAVLALSLLLKPLLVPLVLIPFLARRWWPGAVCLALAAAALLASLPLAGGFSRAHDVLMLLNRGSILRDRFATFNLSILGLADAHDWAGPGVVLVRVAVGLTCLVAVAVVALRQRVWDVPRVAWLAGLLLVTLYLTGSLSEAHYLLALVPGLVGVAFVSDWLPARLLAGLALIGFATPLLRGSPFDQQLLYVAIELATFVACAAATMRGAVGPRSAKVPSPRDHASDAQGSPDLQTAQAAAGSPAP